MKKLSQQGFTLMELMVVIVIVAILAAVAVPLYINYVRDAQRTEAKAAIGAIATAEQVFYQKNGGTVYADLSTLKSSGNLDISEAELKWDFGITFGQKTFNVVATSKANVANPPLKVCYRFSRDTGGVFQADDTCDNPATTP